MIACSDVLTRLPSQVKRSIGMQCPPSPAGIEAINPNGLSWPRDIPIHQYPLAAIHDLQLVHQGDVDATEYVSSSFVASAAARDTATSDLIAVRTAPCPLQTTRVTSITFGIGKTRPDARVLTSERRQGENPSQPSRTRLEHAQVTPSFLIGGGLETRALPAAVGGNLCRLYE